MAAKKPPTIEEAVAAASAPKQGMTADEAENLRKLMAEKLSVNGLVKPKGENTFQVISEFGNNTVSIDAERNVVCTCSDFEGATTLGIPEYKCVDIWAVQHWSTIGPGSTTGSNQPEPDTFVNVTAPVSDAAEPEEAEEAEEETNIVNKLEEGSSDSPERPLSQIEQMTEERRKVFLDLQKPLPKSVIKNRYGWKDKDGNPVYVDYIEWTTAANILDQTVGRNWSFVIKELLPGDGQAAVIGSLTVFGVTREGIGVCGGNSMDIAIKGAASDCLKRCAVMFGIARELYSTDEPAPETQTRAASFAGNIPNAQPTQPLTGFHPAPAAPNGSPVASSLGDMITTKQLGMIRAIAKEANGDADNECRRVLGCNIDELSKRAASDFIGHLQSLQRNNVGTLHPVEEAIVPEPVPAAAVPKASW